MLDHQALRDKQRGMAESTECKLCESMCLTVYQYIQLAERRSFHYLIILVYTEFYQPHNLVRGSMSHRRVEEQGKITRQSKLVRQGKPLIAWFGL